MKNIIKKNLITRGDDKPKLFENKRLISNDVKKKPNNKKFFFWPLSKLVFIIELIKNINEIKIIDVLIDKLPVIIASGNIENKIINEFVVLSIVFIL